MKVFEFRSNITFSIENKGTTDINTGVMAKLQVDSGE